MTTCIRASGHMNRVRRRGGAANDFASIATRRGRKRRSETHDALEARFVAAASASGGAGAGGAGARGAAA